MNSGGDIAVYCSAATSPAVIVHGARGTREVPASTIRMTLQMVMQTIKLAEVRLDMFRQRDGLEIRMAAEYLKKAHALLESMEEPRTVHSSVLQIEAKPTTKYLDI
jgi:hypothetical protein